MGIMRFPESQKGITLVTLVAALAILVIIVAILIGALHRPKSLTRPSDSETASVAPEKATAARPLSGPPAPVSPASSSHGETSKPGMPDDCKQMLVTLYEKVEAWAKTTTETDAIGDKTSCLAAKSYSAKVNEHCRLVPEISFYAQWCESQSFVHPRVLLRRRE